MYVSEVNNYYSKNINFGARFFDVVKFTRTKDAMVQLIGDVPSQIVSLASSVEKLHIALRKLEVQKSNPQAQNCLEVLKTQYGYRGLLETKADGVVLAGNDGKNLIVSSHGVNSIRLREQDAQTGEIVSSLFIQDKKISKTDTKHEIPKDIEYLKHQDIGYQFGDELQTKLDDADYALLRVRRALSAPEFQAEIAKVEPVQISRANILPKVSAVNVAEKPAVEQPVAEVKPVVKNVISAKRIELINSRLNRGEPKKVADEVVEAAPVKRRGRPKGSVNKVKKERPVVQAAPQKEVTVPKIKKPVVQNLLSDKEMELLGDIKTEFKRAYTTLFSGNLSESRRTVFKNGYGEKLVKNSSNSRILTFVGLGNKGENVGVNLFNTKSGEFCHIRLSDKNGMVKDLIIDPAGKAVRRSALVNDKAASQVKDLRIKNAYTREELEELDLVSILKRLKQELGNYNSYLEARVDRSKAWKLVHFGDPTSKRMILSSEELSLVGDVRSIFEDVYKTLNSIDMAANTRTSIKYGYGDKLLRDTSKSRLLNFVGIGNNGENVGVNVVSYQNVVMLHLRITDAKKGLDKSLIINPQGIIKKSCSAVSTSVAPRVLGDENIYSRGEIDDLEIIPVLKRLKKELIDYHSYVEAGVKKTGEWKKAYCKEVKPEKLKAKPHTPILEEIHNRVIKLQKDVDDVVKLMMDYMSGIKR